MHMTTIPAGSLNDRVALVTGAGSGIGKSTAKALAYAGASVALVGRTEEELEETQREIEHGGGDALVLESDISKEEDVRSIMEHIKKRWGRLDIVLANAGVNGVWAPIDQIHAEEWDETVTINLRGTYLTLKHAAALLKRQGGSVIITASINGTRTFSNLGATSYSCTKAAQVALAKMLALEWAQHRIRVNVICPGAISTKIDDSAEKRGLDGPDLPSWAGKGTIPLTDGEPGSAGQVAQLVWFLASEAASHITGTEVYIDGGQSLLG